MKMLELADEAGVDLALVDHASCIPGTNNSKVGMSFRARLAELLEIVTKEEGAE